MSAHILVVDDSRIQAKLLGDLLIKNGYRVTTAGNGQEAIEAARRDKPALILSDIVMPVMSGYEMCSFIKNDPGLCGLPVILLTTLSNPQDLVLGLQAQADYYLTKPFNNQYLLSRVASLLREVPENGMPCIDYKNQAGNDTGDLQITLGGQSHTIRASRRQMLNLLLSTYENAVQQNDELSGMNRQLIQTQRELDQLNNQLTTQTEQLQASQDALKEANARLESLATTDGLTGLKNHRAFKERLDEEFRRAQRDETPLSLILLDVDKFKHFNDTFGHPAGDEVLKKVGHILRESARVSDVVARYGGEEFVILSPNTDRTGSLTLGEKLRAAIEAGNWTEREVTASFGAATLPRAANSHSFDDLHFDTAALLSSADKALYASKTGGRNRVSHADDL